MQGLSEHTESIYKRWFNQLQRADAFLHRSEEAFIRSTLPEIETAALPQPNSFKDKPDRLTFLPENVRQFMTDPSKASHWLKYTAKIGGRTICVHIVHYQKYADDGEGEISAEAEGQGLDDAASPESKGIPLYWMKMYRSHVYKMYAWFHFIAPYVKECDCSKELDVYLYFTPFKKELPAKKGTVIGAAHSNTGFTVPCGTNLSKNGGKSHTEIIIYRYQEFFKVLIHETLHNMDLDFGFNSRDVNVSHLFPGIRHEIILSETYVETWARLLNVAFHCYYDILGSSGTYPVYRTAVRRCLASERAFSLYQANQVLLHMGLNLQQVLSKDPRNASLVSARYDEDTNVFAYYVLGGLATFEADLFLQWCSDTNRHNLIRANAGSAGTDALLLFIEMITSTSTSKSSGDDDDDDDDDDSALDDAVETVMQLAPTAPALLSKTSRMTLWSQ